MHTLNANSENNKDDAAETLFEGVRKEENFSHFNVKGVKMEMKHYIVMHICKMLSSFSVYEWYKTKNKQKRMITSWLWKQFLISYPNTLLWTKWSNNLLQKITHTLQFIGFEYWVRSSNNTQDLAECEWNWTLLVGSTLGSWNHSNISNLTNQTKKFWINGKFYEFFFCHWKTEFYCISTNLNTHFE